MKRVRSLPTLLGAVALGGVMATAALASSATDPNDVNGKLDLRLIKGVKTGGLITLTVGTWGPWASTDLPLTGSPNRLVVLIDTNGNGTTDYRARIVRSGEGLVALISGRGDSFEPVPAIKRSSNRVGFEFPSDVLKPSDDDIAIAATSTYKGGPCTAACVDRATNTGWLDVS